MVIFLLHVLIPNTFPIMKSSTNDFDSLVSKALDGMLGPDEQEKLRKLLSSSTDLQRRYCKFVRNESIFYWEQPQKKSKFSDNLISFPNLSIVATIAAVFLFLASAWLIHTSKNSDGMDEGKSLHFASSSENDKISSLHNTFSTTDSFVQAGVPQINSNKTLKFIELLGEVETKTEFTDEGLLSMQDGLPYVRTDEYLATSSNDGVLPLNDESMIQFSEMKINHVAKTAEVSETLRVYNLNDTNLSPSSVVDAVVHFNQSDSTLNNYTEFSITLSAVENHTHGVYSEIKNSIETVIADNDQSSWEKTEATMEIPPNTDYLVVSLTAKKFGPEIFIANNQKFFADELNLSFVGI